MFEVAWKGYPGENTVQSAETLPEDMVEEYLRLKYEIREAAGEEVQEVEDDMDMVNDSNMEMEKGVSWTAKFMRGGL